MVTVVQPVQYGVITAEIVMVKQAAARLWLEKNKGNRVIRQPRVEFWKRAMMRGEWQISPDAIAFDVAGDLVNGQHRLTALCESELSRPLPFLVVHGLPEEAYSVIDKGTKRTSGDYWRHRGFTNATTLAAILSLVYRWRQGTYLGGQGPGVPTEAKQEALFDENPRLFLRAVEIVSAKPSRLPSMPPSTVGALWFIFAEVDEEGANEFWSGVFSLVELGTGSPMLALRQLLTNYSLRRMKVNNPWRFGVAIKAWNAYRKSKPISLLKFGTSEDMPQPI